MVVDDVETGQTCIEYLRRNNLGRAMFILLEKLPRRDLTPIDTPESVPRLFDLVKPTDPKFGPAFFSVLQNTLVAKDLTQANRIAYGKQRWRVVTLDGQLIDKSGTMSGGGNRVSRGGMNSKQAASQAPSKDQLSTLETNQEQSRAALTEIEGRIQELESQLENLMDNQPKLDIEIQKNQLDLKSHNNLLNDAQNAVRNLEEQSALNPSEVKKSRELEAQVEKAEASVAKVKSNMFAIESKINALQDKIMEMGGIELRSQKARVDSLQEQIETAKEQRDNAEKSKMRSEKESEKLSQNLKQGQKEIDDIAEQLMGLDDGHKQVQSRSDTHQTDAKRVQDIIEDQGEKCSEVQKLIDEETESINARRAKEIELKNRLSENQKALSENEKRLRYLKEALGKLRLRTIPQFDEEDAPEQDELTTYSEDELADFDPEKLKSQIQALKTKLENVKVDADVLDEYQRRNREFMQRNSDYNVAVNERDTSKANHAELCRRRMDEFMAGFHTISLKLKEMYQVWFDSRVQRLIENLDDYVRGECRAGACGQSGPVF